MSEVTPAPPSHRIAYFSMEVALEAEMPTYSGGLGVLAGDTIRSAADLGVPMVVVTLLHRRGYFFQRLGEEGRQMEEPVEWTPADFLEEQPARVEVAIEGRAVQLRAWKYDVHGAGGHVVPVYFLDADLPENDEQDRVLTHHLYGGDARYRLCQEALLGIGGVQMLEALGHASVDRYHMNEGHAGLLTVALAQQEAQGEASPADLEAVRERCVFTTHTPVPAGHDKFPFELVDQVLALPEGRPGDEEAGDDGEALCCPAQLVRRIRELRMNGDEYEGIFRNGSVLNMTHLALTMSQYVNGVAKRHSEVSRLMFGGYSVDAITNGVHAGTWTSDAFQKLFDRHMPGWREDNFSLRYALGVPKQEIWEAHIAQKKQLLYEVQHQTNLTMDRHVLTLGFARRMATYKRAALLFDDLERLRHLAAEVGPLQIVYAGKAHPQDEGGKAMIQRISEAQAALKEDIKIAYLPNYDMSVGRLMTAGVDLWLNTPQPPNEASGTSGMKAALNGVPQLSTMDGWWIEGCIEGVTGWGIGETPINGTPAPDRSRDAEALYDQLGQVILPLYYGQRSDFIEVMRHAIALNGSFFNTQRMVQQYVLKAYF